MANIDAPFGLRPVRMMNGGKIPMRKYANKGATTAVYQGDIVVLQAADGRVLRLANTSTNADIIGVAANYVAAGTAGQELWVYDDPFTVFELQSDGTTAADYTDHIGAVGPVLVTAGSTTTGVSKMELDVSQVTSSGTASNNVVKIIGVSDNVRNDSSSSHCVVEVLVFQHFLNHRSASV